MSTNKTQPKNSFTRTISRNRQLIFDIIIVVSYLSFSVYIIHLFHKEGENCKELAYSLLVGLSGITIGWLIGLFASPFSNEEQKKFGQLSTVIIGFLSGYFLSKIEPLITHLTSNAEVFTQDLILIRFLIFLTSGIFGFLYMFSYRKYYLHGKDIRLADKAKTNEYLPALENSKVTLKNQLRSFPLKNLIITDLEKRIREIGLTGLKGANLNKTFKNKYKTIQKHGVETIIDHTNNLIWQQSGSENELNFFEAEQYIKTINKQSYAGSNQWRLPTIEEALSLMETQQVNGKLYISEKFNSKQGWIWTADEENSKNNWTADFDYGHCGSYPKTNTNFVRAVLVLNESNSTHI